MKEITLRDEQIERAAEAAYDCLGLLLWRGAQWSSASPETRRNWIKGVRAAAPYLQAPWEALSNEEWDDHCLTVMDAGKRVDMIHRGEVDKIIFLRNAALLPKPVDPRREKIVRILKGDVGSLPVGITSFRSRDEPEASQVADAILAALEGEKP